VATKVQPSPTAIEPISFSPDRPAPNCLLIAHWSAMPVVPCAHVSTALPGATPFGATTRPLTAIGSPCRFSLRYRTCQLVAPLTAPGSSVAQIRSPLALPGIGSGGW